MPTGIYPMSGPGQGSGQARRVVECPHVRSISILPGKPASRRRLVNSWDPVGFRAKPLSLATTARTIPTSALVRLPRGRKPELHHVSIREVVYILRTYECVPGIMSWDQRTVVL